MSEQNLKLQKATQVALKFKSSAVDPYQIYTTSTKETMPSYQPLVSSLRKLTIANQTTYSNVTLESPDLHSINVGNTSPIKG